MEKKEIILKIQEIIKNEKNPEVADKQLTQLITEVSNHFEGIDQYELFSFLYEAIGDGWKNANKAFLAEKNYREMLLHAKKCYDINQEKYDYRLGFSSYKLANFYRVVIQCAIYGPNPKVLNDAQQKIYSITEINYKNAIACTMEHAKQGNLKYIELHATCMNELSVMYATVGNYQNAITVAKDGIRLDKAIYDKINDKARCFLYGNRLNTLSVFYMMIKNYPMAMETLETSITVLKEHKDEEPITYGILIGKNYLALGNCYSQIKEKSQLAETAYQRGLDYMENINIKTNNALIYDLITSNMIVGDYYKRTNRNESAKRYYMWAMNQASDLFIKTNDKKYEAIMNRLRPLVN